MKDLSANRANLSKVFVALALAAILAGGAIAAHSQTKQLTAQDLFFGWGKESGLTFAGQKGNMYAFMLKTGDKRDKLLVTAKFVNGNWVEGSTAYPADGIRVQYDKLWRNSHAIHYLCAMASQGRFAEALPKSDAFVTQLFIKGKITFDVIRASNRTYRGGDGEMVAQTDFFLK